MANGSVYWCNENSVGMRREGTACMCSVLGAGGRWCPKMTVRGDRSRKVPACLLVCKHPCSILRLLYLTDRRHCSTEQSTFSSHDSSSYTSPSRLALSSHASHTHHSPLLSQTNKQNANEGRGHKRLQSLNLSMRVIHRALT